MRLILYSLGPNFIRQAIKEDKTLMYEDWKENILPLVYSAPQSLNPSSFSVKEYFAARSLIASRSFQIDEYHGFGMVPSADLFLTHTGHLAMLLYFIDMDLQRLIILLI